MQIDPSQIESTKEILRNGQASEFWRLICQATDESIAFLQEQEDGEAMDELPAEEYVMMTKLLKAKRQYLKKLKTMPNDIIESLTEPSGNLDVDKPADPYWTPKQIQEAQDKSAETD